MKHAWILLLSLAVASCSTEKKETPDYAELLKIKEAIEKGAGNTVERYGEIIGPEKLEGIETNPEFIKLRDQALTDVNSLIVDALEQGVDKDALLACIREKGADSEDCKRYVEQVKETTTPRLKQYRTELRKFIVNHLNRNSNLPKNAEDCKIVRTGTFWQLVDGDTVRINRDEEFEVENLGPAVRKQSVMWINDCMYRLQLLAEGTTAPSASPRDFPDDCFIEIVRVTNDHYVYKIFDTVNGEPGDLTDMGKVFRNKPRTFR